VPVAVDVAPQAGILGIAPEATAPTAALMTTPQMIAAAQVSANQRAAEYASCTIYVGNLSAVISEDQLRQFFQASVGNVVAVRLAGDTEHFVAQSQNVTAITTYAFIQFTSPELAETAMHISGTVVAGRAIRISAAKQPIEKDLVPVRIAPLMPIAPDNAAMKKALELQEKLAAKIASKAAGGGAPSDPPPAAGPTTATGAAVAAAAPTDEKVEKKREGRSRSHERESRRRRSRSRSRSRRRSRSRSGSRRRRHRDRRSRSRSRGKDRDRKKDRHSRSRSRGKHKDSRRSRRSR
jgi:RNA recognition motif-containing protein